MFTWILLHTCADQCLSSPRTCADGHQSSSRTCADPCMSSPRTQRSLAPRGERPIGSARRKARWLRAERDLLAPRTSRVALLGLSGLNPKGESFTTLFIGCTGAPTCFGFGTRSSDRTEAHYARGALKWEVRESCGPFEMGYYAFSRTIKRSSRSGRSDGETGGTPGGWRSH